MKRIDKNVFKWICLTVGVAILACIALGLITGMAAVTDLFKDGEIQSPNMFAEFAETEALSFTQEYDIEDKYTYDLNIVNSKCGKLGDEGGGCDVYIYEFATMEDARQYSMRHGLKIIEDKDFCFSAGAGVFSSKGVVYKGNRAYSFYGEGYFSQRTLIDYINSVFTDQLEE